MAEVVDSIIAELIVKNEAYVRGFNEATAAHDKFLASTNKLKTNTFDLQAEGQKYKAGADRIAGAEDQLTQKVTRSRKARVDAVKQAGSAEVQAEIATQQRITKAVDDGIAARSAAVRRGSGRNIGATVSGRADNARQGLLTGVPGAAADVVAEKEVNSLKIEQIQLEDSLTYLTGKRRTEVAELLAEMRLSNRLEAEGVAESEIALRLEQRRLAVAAERAAANKAGGSRGGIGGANEFALQASGGRFGYSFGPGALAGAAVGVGAAISVEVIRSSIEYGKQLKENADQLGLTTKQLQVYEHAATQAGVSNTQFTSSFGQLNNLLGRAKEGDKQAGQFFSRLGIDIKGAGAAGDILPQLADKIANTGSKSARAAIETKAFGDVGRKLDGAFSGGSKGISDLAQSLERTGQILSDKDIQSLDQTANKLAAVKAQLQVDFAHIVADNAQAIFTLAKALAAVASGAASAINALSRIRNQNIYQTTGSGAEQDSAFGNLIQDQKGREFLKDQLRQRFIAAGNAPELTVNGKPDEATRQAGIKRQQAIIAHAYKQVVNYKEPEPEAPPAATGGGNVFAPTPPKGKSADTLAKEAAARQKHFEDEQAQLSDEFLSSLQALADSTDERSRLAAASAQADHDRRATDIELQVKEKQIDADKEQELKQSNDIVLAGRLAVLAMQKRVEQLQTITALQDQQNEYAKQTLQNQAAFARTTEDRLKNQLAQIDLDQQADRNRAIRTVFDQNASDADRQTAGVALSTNQSRFDQQRAVAREQNLTPGQQYVRSLETTPDTIQQKEVDVLNQFNDGLDKSVSKALHLHGIFGDIVNDLIDMAIKQALIKPLAGALFGGDAGASGGGAGGLFGSLLGGIGKIFGGGGGGWSSAVGASIGGAQPTSMAVSAITGLPAFANGGSLSVLGNGGVDRNVMSINGQPVARINHGETINVVPTNQRVNSPASGPMTLHQTINVDGRNSVTPADFASQIISVSADHANKVAAQAGRSAVQASPAQVRQTQTLKG